MCTTNREYYFNLLCGGLWHTTSPERFQMILDEGYILSDPPIPDKERWHTEQGPRLYPFVRTIGGVSLFDFEGFNPAAYIENHPASSWQEFVPYRRDWGQSVWIEINREMIAENFISGVQLIARWDHDGVRMHCIMPYIEAAHIGPIPVEAFNRVFRCGNDTNGFEEVIE